MSIYIVDVQGFKISDKDFCPKELAIYNGEAIAHYVFRPPFPLSKLPFHLRQQADWLMHNHHCIKWNHGYTHVHQFPQILQHHLIDADIVYVKGREKVTFIQNNTTKRVVEFEEQPAIVPSTPGCLYHSKALCICSLTTVCKLYQQFVMKE